MTIKSRALVYRNLVLDKPEKGTLASLCCCIPICRHPQLVTHIKIDSAAGLEKQDTVGGKTATWFDLIIRTWHVSVLRYIVTMQQWSGMIDNDYVYVALCYPVNVPVM